jgi:cytochrome c551/c552
MKTGIVIASAVSMYLVLLLNSCNSEKEAELLPDEKIMSQGFNLLMQNCFSCHNPDAGAVHTVAPGMFEIKAAYLKKSKNFSEFKTLLVNFLKAPSIENSQMPEALEKYALMPAMSYSDEQNDAIANYLYFSEIENTNWYQAHFESEKNKYAKTSENLSPIETGLQLAMQTKATLGKNLMNAINTKGTAEALDFCSTKAYTLTDSMATVLHANIKRVSDKNRNPLNLADSSQTAFIEQCKIQVEQGQKPVPAIRELNGKYLAFYPIITEEMCMQCHGTVESEIKVETLQKIKERYPDDKATGYKPGQIRGAWVVEWDIR